MSVSIEDIAKSHAEATLPDESYYQNFATPLKPPSAFRNAHRNQLEEFFKFEELREQLEESQKLILSLMPTFITKDEFLKLKGEIDKSIDHFILVALSMGKDLSPDKPLLFQELFGISDDSMIRIYELGSDLVKKNNYKDGNALFVFLSTMAPHVSSYWISQGVCLQAMDRHEDAVEIFKAAKFLKPSDPMPSSYILESLINLKNSEQAKIELEALKNIVHLMDGEDKKSWEQKINGINI